MGDEQPGDDRLAVANDRLRLFLTSDCNLACFYCHNEGQPKGSSYISRELVRTVHSLLAAGGVGKLIFSGGEPLVHPDALDFVAMLSPHAGRTSLITNGLLLDRPLLRALEAAGLNKIRLGVDSFRATKPRPSKGYLDRPFSVKDTIADIREAGIAVDVNVVLTKFNRAEVPAFLEFATVNQVNVKFFEHLRVLPPVPGALVNRMKPMPQVSEEWFMAAMRATLGRLPEFEATDAFAPATMAASVGATEIRYCRYLCTYGRCWAPGTRIDPEGYVYTCMSNRGLDMLSPAMDRLDQRAVVGTASARTCSAAQAP